MRLDLSAEEHINSVLKEFEARLQALERWAEVRCNECGCMMTPTDTEYLLPTCIDCRDNQT